MNDFSKLSGKIATDLNVATSMLKDLSNQRIVSIFGSARTPTDHTFYKHTQEIAYQLGKSGFSICTGGGPGLMQAASKGAKEAGTKSIGLSIELPHEQNSNPYLDIDIHFKNFAQRKIVFSAISNAFIAVPGGFGSLDELFEMLTLMQCGIAPHVPMVLYNQEYWAPLLDFIKNSLLTEKMISQEDVDAIYLVNSVEEAVKVIVENT